MAPLVNSAKYWRSGPGSERCLGLRRRCSWCSIVFVAFLITGWVDYEAAPLHRGRLSHVHCDDQPRGHLYLSTATHGKEKFRPGSFAFPQVRTRTASYPQGIPGL